jgi:hypothetical protein
MTTRAELVAFFSPSGFRRKLAETSLAGKQLLLGSHALINTRHIASLSEAEQDIVYF